MTRQISVIIPSLNGKQILSVCLPTLLKALHEANVDYQILVIDDGSEDGTEHFLRSEYPEIEVIALDTRVGQEKATNLGIRRARHKLIFCSDNDIRLADDFFSFIFDHFEDNNLFALAVQIKDWEGANLVFGGAAGSFQKGMISVWQSVLDNPGSASFFAPSTAIFDRDKLRVLGGCDAVYDSAHLLDVDLSYRARKRGWRIAYEPRSVAYHKGSVTRSKLFPQDRLAYLRLMNQWIFVWKNLTDRRLFAEHALWIGPRLIAAALRGNKPMLWAFVGAVRKLGQIRKGRTAEKRYGKVSDRELLIGLGTGRSGLKQANKAARFSRT